MHGTMLINDDGLATSTAATTAAAALLLSATGAVLTTSAVTVGAGLGVSTTINPAITAAAAVLIPHGEADRELPSPPDGLGLVALPKLRDGVVERIVGIRSAHQSLDAKEDGSDLQSRTPLILEYVQTDPAELVDVGMVDLGQEPHLGRCHGIIGRKEQLELEDAPLVRRIGRTLDSDGEVAEIVGVRSRGNSRNRFGYKALGFLDYSSRELGRVGRCHCLMVCSVGVGVGSELSLLPVVARPIRNRNPTLPSAG